MAAAETTSDSRTKVQVLHRPPTSDGSEGASGGGGVDQDQRTIEAEYETCMLIFSDAFTVGSKLGVTVELNSPRLMTVWIDVCDFPTRAPMLDKIDEMTLGWDLAGAYPELRPHPHPHPHPCRLDPLCFDPHPFTLQSAPWTPARTLADPLGCCEKLREMWREAKPEDGPFLVTYVKWLEARAREKSGA